MGNEPFTVEAQRINALATQRRCPECARVFDLRDEQEAQEFYYGHDCEVDA